MPPHSKNNGNNGIPEDSPFVKQLTLQERAALFNEMVELSGWDLLRQLFRPEIRCRIRDIDEKEAFLYEAVRAQVIQEIFSAPYRVIRQVQQSELGWHSRFGREPPDEDGY